MSEIQPPQHGGEEEVKKSDNTKTKGQKIPPREIRIKAFHDAHELRKRGLSYTEIRNEIYRKYGVWIGKSTIGKWLRGLHNPHNGRYFPLPELLKPSEDLAYVIGVVLGDGNTYENSAGYFIRLEAKDKEFVEEFGRRLGNVLGRKPIRPWKYAEMYTVTVASRTLYELLRKPIDLKRIRKYVEHCPKCAAAFLRGFFDSEGCVDKKGYIVLHNTNYELLVYVQRLLWRYFGIEATGPWPHSQKGKPIHDPKTGKQYKANEDCYYIYILADSLLNFYLYVGFTIKRKQKRLEDYLRRKGLLQED
jgi:intein-encoded DNA endonuclease-like protein